MSGTCLQVSGDISLTCTWRVTPLDMAALKVKTRQSELDRKEEVLALLLERTGAPSPQVSPSGPVGSPGDPGATLSTVSSPNTGLAEQKRLMASRGALSLKVGSVKAHVWVLPTGCCAMLLVSVQHRGADAVHLLPSQHGAVGCARLPSCLCTLESSMQLSCCSRDVKAGCGCRSLRHAT